MDAGDANQLLYARDTLKKNKLWYVNDKWLGAMHQNIDLKSSKSWSFTTWINVKYQENKRVGKGSIKACFNTVFNERFSSMYDHRSFNDFLERCSSPLMNCACNRDTWTQIAWQ